MKFPLISTCGHVLDLLMVLLINDEFLHPALAFPNVTLVPPKPMLSTVAREIPLKHGSDLPSFCSKYSHSLPSHQEHNPRALPGATDWICAQRSSNPHNPHPSQSSVSLSTRTPKTVHPLTHQPGFLSLLLVSNITSQRGVTALNEHSKLLLPLNLLYFFLRI